MRREPSLHITRSRLIKILASCQIEGHKDLADIIMKRGANHSIQNRSIIITNDKIKRDMARIVKSSTGDSKLMNNLIYHIRRNKLRQKGASKIKTSNKQQWTYLNELSSKCIDFCNDFELDKKEGFISYLEIGLPKISSPRNLLRKLIDMYESICMIYESQKIIKDDEDSKLTEDIHNYYKNKIHQQTGIDNSYKKDPIVYKCFVGVKDIIKKYNVPYKMYIDAQFIGLSFTESIATPYQLITDKAIERLNNYLYKNKLKLDIPGKDNTIQLNKVDILKKIKNGNNPDK